MLVGCGDPSALEEEASAQSADLSSTRPKRHTICFSGAAIGEPYQARGNLELASLCREMPGLIRTEDHPFFTWVQGGGKNVLDVVIPILDTNGDGRVTGEDERVALTLVGFSWGGFNAAKFARTILEDERFSSDRKEVERLFVLDPYRRHGLEEATELVVPRNVKRFWSFRHTVAPAPAYECSTGGPFGPYTGRPPVCSAATSCTDYDYSLDERRFDGTRGHNVGHCDLPRVAAKAILELNDRNATDEPLPPQRRVRTQ